MVLAGLSRIYDQISGQQLPPALDRSENVFQEPRHGTLHLHHNGTYVMLPAINRRVFISSACGAAAVASPSKKYRVAVIGHTGQGNYGHCIDVVWNCLEQTNLVAIADADAAGRADALRRIHVARGYADYREMLRQEKPDLVGVGPRTLDEREQMLTAAADAGAHIFTEKPFARSPLEADRVVTLVR